MLANLAKAVGPAVVLVSVGIALLDVSCSPGECSVGEYRCNGAPEVCREECGDLDCRTRWSSIEICGESRTCLMPPNTPPLCVESTAPDPRCGVGASLYCSGDDIVRCSNGYRNATVACGHGDRFEKAWVPGGAGSTHCIEPTPGEATCVPAGVAPDPACAGLTGPVCQGNVLFVCEQGYVVAKTVCATCNVPTATSCTGCVPITTPTCTGYLGAECASSAECAASFVCHAGPDGLSVCTVPCIVAGSTPTGDDAGTAPNDDAGGATGDDAGGATGDDAGADAGSAADAATENCFASYSDNGPARSSYYRFHAGSGGFKCIAGYCAPW